MKEKLLKHIRSHRARKKLKYPFERRLFDRICGMVKEYQLGRDFLLRLERFSELQLKEKLLHARMRPKSYFEPPLFALCSREDYLLTLAIMKRTNNPYLRFAQSPDEVVLSRLLHDRNPSLAAERLGSLHFETLLLCELAGEEVRNLANRVEETEREVQALLRDEELVLKKVACSIGFIECPSGWKENLIEDKRSRLASFRDRIDRLRRFILTVEDAAAESVR